MKVVREHMNRGEGHRPRSGVPATLLLFGVILVLFGVLFGIQYEDGPPSLPIDTERYSLAWFFHKIEFVFAWMGPSFIKELGFAFIIAAMVAHLIERKAHEERIILEKEALDNQNKKFEDHLDRVARGIFRALYKRNFDEEYTDIIEEILEVPFYYRQYELNITLRNNENNPPAHKEILVDFNFRYTVCNISDNNQSFPFSLMIERLSGRPGEHPVSKISFLSDGSLEEYTSPEELDKLDKKESDDENFKRYAQDISIDSNKCVSIHAKAKMEKARFDEFTWRIFQPADGLRINVICNVDGLRVNGVGIVPTSSGSHQPELEQTAPIGYVLDLKKPMMPGHGGQIWWTECPSAPAAGKDEAVHGIGTKSEPPEG